MFIIQFSVNDYYIVLKLVWPNIIVISFNYAFTDNI